MEMPCSLCYIITYCVCLQVLKRRLFEFYDRGGFPLKKTQNKTAIQLLLIYTAAQLFPAVLALLLPKEMELYVSVYGTIASFAIGALSMILLSHHRHYLNTVDRENIVSKGKVIAWGIAGMFLSLIAQQVAFNIESLIFQLPADSANTQSLFLITKEFPIFFIMIAITGPIMEEYVFRKVIFGSLTEHTGTIGAAVISSLLFAFIHMDGHWLVYSSMGFVFCYVYMKTKNIAAPMIAHMLMNTAAILPLLAQMGR